MAIIITKSSYEVTVTGGPGNPRDFVGIYRTNAPIGQFLNWKYLTNNTNHQLVGRTEGVVTFSLTNPTGTYEFRFVALDANGVMTLIGKPDPFTFGPWPMNITFDLPPEGAI